MARLRSDQKIIFKGLLLGFGIFGAIAAGVTWLALQTPAPAPVGLLLFGAVMFWIIKSEQDYPLRPRSDDEPPLAVDRSPLIPRPPLLAASERQAWPQD
jgi:hypothetical protein